MTDLKGQRLLQVPFHRCPEVTANHQTDQHLEDLTFSVRRGACVGRAPSNVHRVGPWGRFDCSRSDLSTSYSGKDACSTTANTAQEIPAFPKLKEVKSYCCQGNSSAVCL